MAKFTKDPLKEGEVTELIPYSINLESRVDEVIEEVNTDLSKNEDDISIVKNLLDELKLASYALTLRSGWGTNSAFSEPKVFKEGTRVTMQGFVTGGAANSTITTLPSNCRPSKAMRFKTASAGTETLVQINVDGSVVVQGKNTTNIFLDGITYYQ